MQVSVDVHKIIISTIHSSGFFLFFFTSGGGVVDMLVRLFISEQIIKDANFMCFLFSVKHPQKFRELRMSLSDISRTIFNVYTYTFNPQLVIKT